MSIPRACLLLAVWSAVLGPATAQRRPRSSPFAGDERLDRRVTVRWQKVPVSEALQELSKATGAKLACDRLIQDEPVMAAASGIAARTLAEQLAKLLQFTWVRKGGTAEAPAYLLFQDASQQAAEQEAVNRGFRQVVEALNSEIARARRLSQLPPERLQQEGERAEQALLAGGLPGLMAAVSMQGDMRAAGRVTDAWTTRSATCPMGRVMLDLLARLTPAQWQRLREEEVVVFSTAPREGELPLPRDLEEPLRGAKPEVSLPKGIFARFDPRMEGALTGREQAMQAKWVEAPAVRLVVHLNLRLGSTPAGTLRVTPAMEGDPSRGPAFALSGVTLFGVPRLDAAAAEEPAAREERLAADPVLGKKASLKLPPPSRKEGTAVLLAAGLSPADVLPAIEAAYGVKLLGDAYSRQSLTRFPPPSGGPEPLYQVLDRLAGTARVWDREGEVIRLRSRTWANDRRAEIPVRLLRAWFATRAGKWRFTLGELAQIAAALRDEQVENLMFAELEQGRDGLADDLVSLGEHRAILRLYDGLSPNQREQLAAGRPLPARGLPPAQQALLLHVNRSQNRSMAAFFDGPRPPRRPGQVAQAMVSLSHAPDGHEHTFSVTYPDGQRDHYEVKLIPAGASEEPRPAPPHPG